MPTPNPVPFSQAQQQGARAPNVVVQDYFAKDFFTYEVDFTAAIAVSASAQSSFNIQADSDFLLSKLAFLMQGTSFGASILIQDTGSGRNLMNQAIPIANIFGTGSLPFILPRQRGFRANATINITVTNLDATAGHTITGLYLSFIGEKGFYRGNVSPLNALM
jgi:hypothetical protein